MYSFKQIGLPEKESIKELFTSVFTKEPWNDNWDDKQQLDLCIQELIGQNFSLSFGLYKEEELVGISLGYIKHWYTGTEYLINEFCIKTDLQRCGAGTFFISEIEKAIKEIGINHIFLLTERDAPAFKFYKKNGFIPCESTVAFIKEV